METSSEQRASRGTAGSSALAALRAAWGCDCDGRSHRKGGNSPSAPGREVERHLDVIQSVTGHRPPTCPWRAMYDPLVSHVGNLALASNRGYISKRIPDDPPAILLDGLDVFFVAQEKGLEHKRKFLEQKSKKRGGGSAPSKPQGFRSVRRGRGRRRG